MGKLEKTKLNVLATLMRQLISTLCGIVMPRMLIATFGAVVYGATASITQFLSYITLLNGGIGSVARGALYEPLAKGDRAQISRIYRTVRGFFRKVGVVFLFYTLALAWFYHDIAQVTAFDRKFTFGLVIVISLSTMCDYLGGLADMTLMNADQKQYLTNTGIAVVSILNILLIAALVKVGAGIHVVKLSTAAVFILRRAVWAVYVKRHYRLPKVPAEGFRLEQQRTGMGQHLAFFLHINADIVLLTVFADLRLVTVYSIYHLVVRSIWDISSSFAGGMEGAFGELIARGRQKELVRSCERYSLMITLVTVALFSCTGVLILPFVQLYMAGVSDVDFIRPLFGLALILTEALNCMSLPFVSMTVSANRLKQTCWGSYGEAVLNVGLSLILIQWDPLLGVALGTLAATLFKSLFYMTYTVRHILHTRLRTTMGRFLWAAALILTLSCLGMTLLRRVPMESFLIWGLWAAGVFLAVGMVTLIFGFMAFPGELKPMLALLAARFCKNRG